VAEFWCTDVQISAIISPKYRFLQEIAMLEFKGRGSVFATLLFALALNGCQSNKNLTPKNAAILAQQYMETETPNGDIKVQCFICQFLNRALPKGHPAERDFITLQNAGLVKPAPTASTSFEYAPTEKLSALTLPNGMVKIGNQKVTSVDKLILASDTVASGLATVQTDMNDLGRVFVSQRWIAGQRDGAKQGEVTFAKKPDGGWTCVSLER
jgi:hypothetical protein